MGQNLLKPMPLRLNRKKDSVPMLRNRVGTEVSEGKAAQANKGRVQAKKNIPRRTSQENPNKDK